MINQDFQSWASSLDCTSTSQTTACVTRPAAICPQVDQSAMIIYSIKWHNEAVFSQPPWLLLSSTSFDLLTVETPMFIPVLSMHGHNRWEWMLLQSFWTI